MVQISQAIPSDVTAIQNLLRETWLDTYGDHLSQATLDEVYKNWQSIDFLTRQIENPEMYFPVAKEGSEIAGIATARQPEEAVVLFRLYVSPQHQHKGVGSVLLEDVINHFPTAKTIQLHVEEMNPKGQAFYKKHGFREIKREEEKVVNEVINQILMEKSL
jgi:ribosomal protein S18 acetylase RimI-like enzyme